MNTRYGGLHVLVDDDPVWNRDPVAQAALACAGGAREGLCVGKKGMNGVALAWRRPQNLNKGIFNIFGKLFPYIRIFKFKKINEKNI